jgi:hypothetical protein
MNKNGHKEFLSRLDASRKSTFLVAQYLHCSGYNINIPAFDYRDPDSNWEDHVDDGDLYIWKEHEVPHRIDVKHISMEFTTRDSFRFSHIFVADIRAVERANPFPLAYITTNQSCTHMAIIWGKTKKHWVPYDVYASNTDKMITVMRCPVEHVDFRSFNNE